MRRAKVLLSLSLSLGRFGSFSLSSSADSDTGLSASLKHASSTARCFAMTSPNSLVISSRTSLCRVSLPPLRIASSSASCMSSALVKPVERS